MIHGVKPTPAGNFAAAVIIPAMRATRALVRRLTANYSDGITEAGLGPPDPDLAEAQHAGYRQALADCGLALEVLRGDPRFPDGVFVEDAAIATAHGAIVTRPGASSRRGEVDAVRTALAAWLPIVGEIEPPGTLDGGDVCEAGQRFLIGVTARTNEAGARALAALLKGLGYRTTILDLRRIPSLLHLKTGLSCVGERRLLAIDALAGRSELVGFEIVPVAPEEAYGANAIRAGDRVLIPSSSPRLGAALQELGETVVALDMSEFRKMDGGLSCLSIRW